MTEGEFKAIPDAGFELSSKIYELLNLAQSLKYIKKGVNETVKSITKGTTEIVILAADTKPLELVSPVVRHCEENSIPYCFVDSQACLG